MVITLDMFLTTAVAVLVIFLGRFMRDRVYFLQKYLIPVPVVGGILVTIFVLFGYMTNTFQINFDMTLSDFFMLVFYTSIGFTASIPLLKKGGIDTAKLLILSIIFVILQNSLGVIGSKILDINPLVGVATGSVPMTGGHGTSAVFGPELEKLGLHGANTIALASATFGLVAGSIVGGPIGRYLVEKKTNGNRDVNQKLSADESSIYKGEVTIKGFEESAFTMLLAMALGILISKLLNKTGMKFPASVGGMLASGLLVNLNGEKNRFKIHHDELHLMGNISLLIFLALSMMKLKLWEIADLMGPMIILLLAQVLLMVIFSIFISFRVLGSDYEAAVTTVGFCGYSLGAVPTGVANMQSITEKYGEAPRSFFIVPLVGSLFINIFNSIIVTVFMNVFA